MKLRALLPWVLLPLTLAAAQAETVGRTEFALPSPEWQPLVRYERALKYNAGATADPLHTGVYYLPGAGPAPRALLQVTSTAGGHRGGSVRWTSETCPAPREGYYTDDSDTNRTSDRRDCLVVNPRFAARTYFADVPEVQQALDAARLEWPRSAASIRSLVASVTGELLRVHLVLARPLRENGLPAPAATQLWGVPAPQVAYGERLREATRRAVMSIGGALALPPFELEP